MKVSQAIHVTKRKIRDDQKLVHQLFRSELDDPSQGWANKSNFSAQYDSNRDNEMSTKNVITVKKTSEIRTFGPPKQVFTYHAASHFEDIGVGSVKVLHRRKARRIYLPDTDNIGVGRSDLSFYLQSKKNQKEGANRSYHIKKHTSSKCVGGILEYNIDCAINEKLSATVKTKSGTTSPHFIIGNNAEIEINTVETKMGTTGTQYETKHENETREVIFKPLKTEPKIIEIKPVNKFSEQTQKSKHFDKLSEDNIEADKKAKELGKTYSSDSLVKHVHELDNPCNDKHSKSSFQDALENTLEREYRKMFSTAKPKHTKHRSKVSEFKSASMLRRRFEALKRGIVKKNDSRLTKDDSMLSNMSNNESITPIKKDASVTSDPPSLISRSISDSKKFSPVLDETVELVKNKIPLYRKGKNSVQWQSTDVECSGVKGMFKLWGKKFNFEDEVYDKRQPTSTSSDISSKEQEKEAKPLTQVSVKKSEKEMKPSSQVTVKKLRKETELPMKTTIQKEERKGKKFFFFKKKCKKEKIADISKESYHSKKNVTAGRCELKDGLVINIGANTTSKVIAKIPEKHKDITRAAWLKKFMSKTIESTKSVNVRWNNHMYTTSSSTVFELLDSVYKNTGDVLKSRSETSTSVTQSSAFRSFTGHKVNFVQDIEAWMIPNTIPEMQIKQIAVKKDSKKEIIDKYSFGSISDQRCFIDKCEAFAHKIEVVLHSNNLPNTEGKRVSSEYLLINIPKDFFSSSNESKRNHSSDEEVYKIVEYETNSEIRRGIKVTNEKGYQRSNEIEVIVSVQDSDNFEKKILDTVIKRTPNLRDVAIQGSNVKLPQRCDVIGVGIITQRDLREIRKPILKIQNDLTAEDLYGSVPMPRLSHEKCDFAESYLIDGIDLYSWCVSDSHLRSCSEKSTPSFQNQEDGSKSCPNIYDDFLTTTIVASGATSSGNHFTYDDQPPDAETFTDKFFKKFKKSSKVKAESKSSEKRVQPKESLEVYKRRRVYAAAAIKARWAHCNLVDKPVSVPSVECKNSSSTFKERVTETKPPASPKPKSRNKHVSMSACPEKMVPKNKNDELQSIAREENSNVTSPIEITQNPLCNGICHPPPGHDFPKSQYESFKVSCSPSLQRTCPQTTKEDSPTKLHLAPSTPGLSDLPCMTSQVRTNVSQLSHSFTDTNTGLAARREESPLSRTKYSHLCTVVTTSPLSSSSGWKDSNSPCSGYPTVLNCGQSSLIPPTENVSPACKPCLLTKKISPVASILPWNRSYSSFKKSSRVRSNKTPTAKIKEGINKEMNLPSLCIDSISTLYSDLGNQLPPVLYQIDPSEYCLSNPSRDIGPDHNIKPKTAQQKSPITLLSSKGSPNNKQQLCEKTNQKTYQTQALSPCVSKLNTSPKKSLTSVAKQQNSSETRLCRSGSKTNLLLQKDSPTQKTSEGRKCCKSPTSQNDKTHTQPSKTPHQPESKIDSVNENRSPTHKTPNAPPDKKISHKHTKTSGAQDFPWPLDRTDHGRPERLSQTSQTKSKLSHQCHKNCSSEQAGLKCTSQVLLPKKEKDCAPDCSSQINFKAADPRTSPVAPQDQPPSSDTSCVQPSSKTSVRLKSDLLSKQSNKPTTDNSGITIRTKVPGVFIKVEPLSKRLGSSQSSVSNNFEKLQSEEQLPICEDVMLKPNEKSLVPEKIRQEHRHPVNIRVTDKNGRTLYERRDYTRDCNQRHSLVEHLYKDSKINRVETPAVVSNETAYRDEQNLVGNKSDQNLSNLVKIHFKLRITQGENTTEINIGNEAIDKKPRTKTDIKKACPEIFIVNDGADKMKDISTNDINIKISVRNSESKDTNVENNRCAEFSKVMAEKFQTESTGYGSLTVDENEGHVLSVHRATINLSSPEVSHTHSKISNEEPSKELTEYEKNPTVSSYSIEPMQPDIRENENIAEGTISSNRDSQIEKTDDTNTNESDLPDFNDTDEQDAVLLALKASDEWYDEYVVSNHSSKETKKKLLKKVIQKAGKTQVKSKETVRELREMLKIVLTDSSDSEDQINGDELIKDIKYTALKPNYFRDSDSMNNYYQLDGSTQPLGDEKTQLIKSSDSDANNPTFKGCMCDKVAEKLKKANIKSGCCCRQKTTDEETNCDLRNDLDFFLLNYNTAEYIDVETQNSKYMYNKINSANVSLRGNNTFERTVEGIEVIENIKITKSSKDRQKVSKIASKRQSLVKDRSSAQAHQNSAINVSKDNEVNVLNKHSSEHSKKSISKHLEHNSNSESLIEGLESDVLQSFAVKKAVLEIYAQKTERGDHFVAKVPKFAYDKENEIAETFNRLVTQSSKNAGRKNIVMMSMRPW